MTDDERRRFGPPDDTAPPGDDVFVYDDWPPPLEGSARYERPPVEAPEEPRVGWLAALLGLKRRERLNARLRRLNEAIAAEPEAAANYVLRGELRLKLRENADAADDFHTALVLAEKSFAESDWGLVPQAVADRALAGLRRAGYAVRPVRLAETPRRGQRE